MLEGPRRHQRLNLRQHLPPLRVAAGRLTVVRPVIAHVDLPLVVIKHDRLRTRRERQRGDLVLRKGPAVSGAVHEDRLPADAAHIFPARLGRGIGIDENVPQGDGLVDHDVLRRRVPVEAVFGGHDRERIVRPAMIEAEHALRVLDHREMPAYMVEYLMRSLRACELQRLAVDARSQILSEDRCIGKGECVIELVGAR